MSIDQSETIDVISTSPQGKIFLSISDHYSWSEISHLKMLEDKINAYLQFIESSQMLTDYPNCVGRELVIDIVMKYEPNPDGQSFLEKAKLIVHNAGIGFQWRVLIPNK